jgi:hypothetical protein
MKKQHTPPPAPDRLPAMFVGDELLPPEPPPVPAQARQTTAMLPEDLHVVVEGTSTNRLPFLAAFLMAAAIPGLMLFNSMWLRPDLEQFAGGAAIAAAITGLGALGHRLIVKHRKEFRLTDAGPVMEVWHAGDRRPWVTRIPWTEIADYTLSIDDDMVILRIASVRGYTITLKDALPRLSTREFVRRFTEQAERYPRAPVPEAGVVLDHDRFSVVGCTGVFALVVLVLIMSNTTDLSSRQQIATLFAIVIIMHGLHIWGMLDDADIAHLDGTSQRLMARLRRWLRRVLNIRQT